MSGEDYIARAAALQVVRAAREGGHFFCEQLPAMDVERFLVALREDAADVAPVSLALVGYGPSDIDLRAGLDALGFAVGHVTTDLHVAARWRNEPDLHTNIVALATGRHPGVSTLAHFPQGDPRVFARDLLRWALTPQAQLVATPPQAVLLGVLAEESDLSPLVSLSGVADFLATWRELRTGDELGAPRQALPRLGILPDRDLLNASNDIADRLLKNFSLAREIARMPGSRLDGIRRRVNRGSPDARRKGEHVLERAETIRRVGDFDAYSALDYEEALEVFKPASRPAVPRDEPDEPPQPEVRDGHAVTKDGGELLIDGENDALEGVVDRIREALTDAVDGDQDSASGHYELAGDDQAFEFDVEREVLTWVRFFCSADAWGGFFEARTASFEDALRDYRQCEPTLFAPLQPSIPHDGQPYDVRSLIEAMQGELSGTGPATEDLCDLWDGIVAARAAVLGHLDILIHQPMLALAGQAPLRAVVSELLQVWERLYAALAEHHAAMHEIDHAWTQVLFEAVASLDIVQIKTTAATGKTSWKAVLLPTHPLHLWRYERIAALARGLKLEGMDRDAVLEQLQRPEHYLGVVYLTSLPAGRGGNQPLPVARDHRGLAVFENLRNAYSGDDGVDALQHCVRQFAQIYVNHLRPLRLALINPPNASRTLVKLLNRGRGLPALRAALSVDIYATPDHEARLLGARRFSTADRDQLEEHIAAGRLELRVHESIRPLEDLLGALRGSPVHIVAVFDEATTAMRHQPGGVNLLPMSPFAIRRRIGFQGIHRKVELRPSLDESVFRSFYDMVGKLHGAHASQTPQASADAERMAGHIDGALAHDPPGAFWFFFADRALPTPGRIGAARVLERHYARRRSVCYDISYERLALLLRSPLDHFNLRFPAAELRKLLEEGVALIGDGLISLFKADAQPDTTGVRGFAGMLVAARDYRDRHPGALVVSVDTKLARLWLRLADTDTAERCDLLALRHDDGVLTVDAIEVKTASRDTGVEQPEIEKATRQLMATLAAIQSGVDEGREQPGQQPSPLSAPRQEMLKEVFVSGCQSLIASREDRTRWARWLQVLFRQEEGADEIRLRGTVYAVELGNNKPSQDESLQGEPYAISVFRLREQRIQTLISSASEPPTGGRGGEDSDGPPSPATSPAPPSRPSPRGEDGGGGEDADGQLSPATSPALLSPPQPRSEDDGGSAVPPPESEPPTLPSGRTVESVPADLGIRFAVGHSVSAGERRPYWLHPSNTRLNQLNIGVVGDLGTGKTQLTKALIHQFTRHGAHNRGHAPKFLIFDYKRDYTKLDFVEAVGARVVAPHRIPLNVFELPATRGHLPAARLGRVKFLNDVLQKIYGGIGPRQRNHLKTAVMRAYEADAAGAPTLKDVLREYADVVGDKVDAPYSILSDLVDLEIFVERSTEAEGFDEFFAGVTVIDLAALGIGEKERNMLLVLFLNLYYEYMINLVKQPYLGRDPQLRFIDSMLLVDEADNIMKYNFDILRQVLLQGREFGVGVVLASQFLSHFRTRETDYAEPLLTWFIHKVPNVSQRELQSIGLSRVVSSTVEAVKSLDVHHCLYKTLDVPGRFMRALPFYERESAVTHYD